jgi:Outer membrane protein beta-barrel domain
VNVCATAVRASVAAVLLALIAPSPVFAEWQLRPFIGVTFAAETTLFDLDHAAAESKFTVGANALVLGEFLGVEADLGHTPGFFQRGTQNLIVGSRVTTLTGNMVLALPRRLAQYSLRPYVVGGAGIMYARSEDVVDVLTVSRTLAALDIGGGVTGFFTNRIGVSWDVRYFRSIGAGDNNGLSFGNEHLSFWRAMMGGVVRVGKVSP